MKVMQVERGGGKWAVEVEKQKKERRRGEKGHDRAMAHRISDRSHRHPLEPRPPNSCSPGDDRQTSDGLATSRALFT